MIEQVFSGTCASCGRPLVQVLAESYTRTYHPAVQYDEKNSGRCPFLLRMPGTETYSEPVYVLDVPGSVFILDKNQ